MNIIKNVQDGVLNVAIEGRLDTNTARELDEALAEETAVHDNIVLDFAKLQYVSSAGLRVLLKTQKQMKGKAFSLTNVSQSIMEVFEITGFVDFLNIT